MSSVPPPESHTKSSLPKVDNPDDHDIGIQDNYVSWALKNQKVLPPITWENWFFEVNWLNATIVGFPTLVAIYALFNVKLRWETALFSVFYYFITALGITAGYHRLWSHRSYNASRPLQYFLALAGAGAAQGSIRWWSRGHRAHHRYTDTDLDPYSAHKGLLYSHIGWIVLKPRRKPGASDVSDLKKNDISRWQDRNYLYIMLIMAFVAPTVIAGLFWGDWKGGYFYAGAVRLVFVHHSTFCINSLAHYLGDSPFDDKHTPRDNVITALVTVGEGYHNFHHQFPMDYRNAIKWYQYDPTKWFIWSCGQLGLASQLKTFSENEIHKGQLTMQLKKLRTVQENLVWAPEMSDLPVVSWDKFQEESAKRPLVLISGFIHDLSTFMEEHPGGRHLLVKMIGKDATTAFFGGVYEHSNAAHNLLSMKRVGILAGGAPHGLDDKMIPPAQRLRIAQYNEISNSPYSSSAMSDVENGML